MSKINEIERWHKLGYAQGVADSKREPLSNDEIYNLMPKNQWQSFIELARSIEKAHGIGGEE